MLRDLSHLALTLVVTMVLAGCQAAATPEPPAPAETPSEATAQVPEAGGETGLRNSEYVGPPLTKDPITLRILRCERNKEVEQAYTEWKSNFTAAYPNITLEEEIVPWDDLYEKVQIEAAAGDPPDIFYLDGPMVRSYCYDDILLPLDDYLSQEYLNDILPATRIEQSCEGKLHALPGNQSTLDFFFNRDMFAAAGLETPPETDDPYAGWTWEEALAAWKKLTQDPAGTGSPTVWGLGSSEFGSGGPGSLFYYEGIYIRGKGDPNAPTDSSQYMTFAAISEDGTKVSGYLDTPEAIEGMEFYQSLFQEHKVTPTMGVPRQFMDETAATMIKTDLYVSELGFGAPDLNWGVSPIPHYSDGVPFSHSGSSAWAVSKGTKHPNEAAAFAIYFNSLVQRIRYATLTNTIPARFSIFEALQQWNSYPNTMFRNVLANIGHPRPPGPCYSQYQLMADRAIKDIALGADPAQALQSAASELDSYCAKFKE